MIKNTCNYNNNDNNTCNDNNNDDNNNKYWSNIARVADPAQCACITPLVIYVYTRSVTKQKESLIPNDFVIVAKQIVLVTIQIYLFRPENNVLLMLVDNQFARNGC